MRTVLRARPLLALVVLLLGGSCRTRLLVSDVPTDTCSSAIDGIPFRVRETHTIRVFQWQKATLRTTICKGRAETCVVRPGRFVEVMSKEIAFPNQRRLFALNYRADQFTEASLDLSYFPDNTLRTVTVHGTPNATGLAQIATSGGAIGQKALTAEEEAAKRAKTLRDAQQQKESGDLTSLLAYMETIDTLRQHLTTWEAWENGAAHGLAPADYASQKDTYEHKARTLLKDAMLAAAKIGRTLFDGNPFDLKIASIYALVIGKPPVIR